MTCFQSTSLSLHYTTGGGKSGVLLHEIPNNGSKCLLPGGIAAQNASQHKKGLLHTPFAFLWVVCPAACAPIRRTNPADND